MSKKRRPPLKQAHTSERSVRFAIAGNPFAIISMMTSANMEGSERLLEQIRQARRNRRPLPASFASDAEALYSSRER